MNGWMELNVPSKYFFLQQKDIINSVSVQFNQQLRIYIWFFILSKQYIQKYTVPIYGIIFNVHACLFFFIDLFKLFYRRKTFIVFVKQDCWLRCDNVVSTKVCGVLFTWSETHTHTQRKSVKRVVKVLVAMATLCNLH